MTPFETTLPTTVTMTPAPAVPPTEPPSTATTTPAPTEVYTTVTSTPAPSTEAPAPAPKTTPAPYNPCATAPTPAPAPKPTPAPTPANPCATVVRKYSSEGQPVFQKQATKSCPTWAFPIIGAFAMISCISLAVGLRKKLRRSARQTSLVRPVANDDGLPTETEGPIE